MNFSGHDALECENGQDIPITSPFFNRNLTRFRSVPIPNRSNEQWSTNYLSFPLRNFLSSVAFKYPSSPWITDYEHETRTFHHGAEAIRREIRCKRIAEFEQQVWDDGSQAFIGRYHMISCSKDLNYATKIFGEIIMSIFLVFMVIFPCLQFVICYIGAYLLQFIHYGHSHWTFFIKN